MPERSTSWRATFSSALLVGRPPPRSSSARVNVMRLAADHRILTRTSERPLQQVGEHGDALQTCRRGQFGKRVRAFRCQSSQVDRSRAAERYGWPGGTTRLAASALARFLTANGHRRGIGLLRLRPTQEPRPPTAKNGHRSELRAPPLSRRPRRSRCDTSSPLTRVTQRPSSPAPRPSGQERSRCLLTCLGGLLESIDTRAVPLRRGIGSRHLTPGYVKPDEVPTGPEQSAAGRSGEGLTCTLHVSGHRIGPLRQIAQPCRGPRPSRDRATAPPPQPRRPTGRASEESEPCWPSR